MKVDDVLEVIRARWAQSPKIKQDTIGVLENLPYADGLVTPECIAKLVFDLAAAQSEVRTLKGWGDYVTQDLDEAIFYAECVAEEMEVHTPGYAPECGAQHRRIAEWLKELKKRREGANV